MTRAADRPEVVVFDFDGTLVDSMSTFAEIASNVMPKYFAIDKLEAKRRYYETSGLPFFQQLEAIFPGNPANARAADEYESTKKLSYFDERPYPDAAPTLAMLKGMGFRTAVSSNNFQELVDEYVRRKGLKLDEVLGFRDGFAKGEAHFAHIVRTMNVPRAGIVFVGDSIKDGERARDSGVGFIAKLGIFTRDDFEERFPGTPVIANLSELGDILSCRR